MWEAEFQLCCHVIDLCALPFEFQVMISALKKF